MTPHPRKIRLFHAPRTRAFTALWLLEELGLDYELESFRLDSGRHHQDDYRALNPMGKVPLVLDGDRPVAEMGAIALYFTDLHPELGLAPAYDDPRRPAYLRWVLFASAIMEPAFAQKFLKFEMPRGQAAWGSFEVMLENLEQGLSTGPWLLGDDFSAADVVVGSNVRFGTVFGILPTEGVLGEYIARLTDRAAFKRALAAEEAAAARLYPADEPG